MKIRLENVNLSSNSGPNSFAQKLVKYLLKEQHSLVRENYDAALCFIETHNNLDSNRIFQRLDGIYYNTDFDYKAQNSNIFNTYKRAKGVIFQSEFSKKLVTKFFGEHDNTCIIHNGADLELIESIKPIENKTLDLYENVWSCAATWRPHKRLNENIKYFLEHKGGRDCLVVAGKPDYHYKEPNIFYVGELPYEKLLSLYKKSKTFIHLGWLDNCPNVVVDARASGCDIVCTSDGGTQEVAGPGAIVIQENWDFEPTKLYQPPPLDYTKKIKNKYNSCYNMKEIAEKYVEFMK